MATVGPVKGKGDGVRSEYVRRGVPVRVLDPAKRSGRGRTGTIKRTCSHPSYLATEVRFDDGSVELYWYHELELLADDATNASRFHRGGGWNPDNLHRRQG